MNKHHALVAKNRSWTILGDAAQPDMALGNGNLFGAKFAFLWAPAESLYRRVILDPWGTLNTTIFTEIIIWERLLVCSFILLHHWKQEHSKTWIWVRVWFQYYMMDLPAENIRTVNQGMRVSGSCPVLEIWKTDIHGFYSSPGHCIGIHQDRTSDTAKDQRTKYI